MFDDETGASDSAFNSPAEAPARSSSFPKPLRLREALALDMALLIVAKRRSRRCSPSQNSNFSDFDASSSRWVRQRATFFVQSRAMRVPVPVLVPVVAVGGTRSTSTSSLEATLLERYHPKKTRAALTKLAKRVELGLEGEGRGRGRGRGGGGEPARQQGREEEPSGAIITTPTAVLPGIEAKLDLLDSLKFGLGYTVLQRYPVEFLDESALELWSIMAAVLFTTGFSPESIGALFQKHPCLFASAVQSPENVKELFEWLREQGIVEADALRVVNRFPLILQADVGSFLEPRLAYLAGELEMPREEVAKSIVRHPELLSVESAWVQTRVSYYRQQLGLGAEDVRALFRRQPSAFAVDVERYLVPMTAIMREYFGNTSSSSSSSSSSSLSTAVVKSGLLSRSVDTVRARIRAWNELGMSKEDLRVALRRFPRLLCYPVDRDPKYTDKLAFLKAELGVDVPAAVRSFPAVVSYSLDRRIRPRILGIKKLTGKAPALQQLAMTEAAFLKKHGVEPTAYAAFVNDEL